MQTRIIHLRLPLNAGSPVHSASGLPSARVLFSLLLFMFATGVFPGPIGLPVPDGLKSPRDLNPDSAQSAALFSEVKTTDNNGINNTGLVPSDVTTADFNNDGLIDIVITYAFDDALEYYINLGNGQFELAAILEVGVNDGPLNDLPRQAVADDYDNDGFLDIAVVCSGNPETVPVFTTDPTVGILYGHAGGFEPFQLIEFNAIDNTIVFSSILISGHLNQDEKPDLVVGHHNSKGITFLYNMGNRRWDSSEQILVDTLETGPEDLQLVDLNQDGRDELIITNENDIQIWRGNAFVGFPNQITVVDGESFTASGIANLDGNHRWDLVVIDGASNAIRILMNITETGEVTEEHVIPLNDEDTPIDLVIYDMNLDGMDDIGVVNQAADMANIYLGGINEGVDLPPIRLVDEFQTSRRPRSVGYADLNGDQKYDLIVVNDGDNCCGPDNQDINIIYNHFDPPEESFMRGLSASAPGLQLPVYLDRPRGLAWDATRQCLWTLDRRARELVRMNAEGNLLERIPFRSIERPGQPIMDPGDITVDSEGHLWVTDRLGGTIIRIPLDGTDPGFSFSINHPGPGQPTGITFDPAAGLLYTGSHNSAQIIAYTLLGVPAKVDPIIPVRDLAWNRAENTLWFIPESFPNMIRFFTPTADGIDPAINEKFIALTDVANIMQVDSGRSIAIDTDGRRFWLLTDTGLLIQASLDAPASIFSVTELRLLRDIRALVRESDGGLLLGDSGLLGTLVSINPAGNIMGQLRLNSIDVEHPIKISGLCSSDQTIGILDGRNSEIRVVDKTGSEVSRFGNEFLESHRIGGIHQDRVSGHFLVGLPGRIREFNHELSTGDIATTGPAVINHELPINITPSCLTSRPDHHGLSVFSSSQARLTFLDEAFNPDGTLFRTSHFPPGMIVNAYSFPSAGEFSSNAGVVPDSRYGTSRVNTPGDIWFAAGRGQSNLVSSTVIEPGSAADPVWLSLP
jgi:hypothetical protein